MRIPADHIECSGPGVDLIDLPEGVAVRLADPVKDFGYARNTVTLVYDLSACRQVCLTFEAREYGDEPHAPPVSPFSSDIAFDGVAVSGDGEHWYEVQALRHLRSDRFTRYEVDLDAAVAAHALAYNDTFAIRFSQYDNNPMPMDGIALRRIVLTAEVVPPALHLRLDDDAASPVVLDAGGRYPQTLSDPGGNPNTEAHTTEGVVGTALAFDGADDYLRLTSESHRPYLDAGRDFTLAFWWRAFPPHPAGTLHLLGNYAHQTGESCFFFFTNAGRVHCWVREYWPEGSRSISAQWDNGTDGHWHHYALTRRGTTIRLYQDGQLAVTDTDAHNALGLAPASQSLTLGRAPVGGQHCPGAFDELRLYDRGLSGALLGSII